MNNKRRYIYIYIYIQECKLDDMRINKKKNAFSFFVYRISIFGIIFFNFNISKHSTITIVLSSPLFLFYFIVFFYIPLPLFYVSLKKNIMANNTPLKELTNIAGRNGLSNLHIPTITDGAEDVAGMK